LLLSPTDSSQALNNIDFTSVGNNITQDTNSFRKIQKILKLSDASTNLDISTNNSLFRRVDNLYLGAGFANNNSHFYGTWRQHNFSSANTTTPNYSTLVDGKSFLKFFNYTLTPQQLNTTLINNQRLVNDKNSVMKKFDLTGLDSGKFILDNILQTPQFTLSEHRGDPLKGFTLQSMLMNFNKFTSYDFLINNNEPEAFIRYFNLKKQQSHKTNSNFFSSDEFFIKAKNNFYS
jgi:hypothetical protein